MGEVSFLSFTTHFDKYVGILSNPSVSQCCQVNLIIMLMGYDSPHPHLTVLAYRLQKSYHRTHFYVFKSCGSEVNMQVHVSSHSSSVVHKAGHTTLLVTNLLVKR